MEATYTAIQGLAEQMWEAFEKDQRTSGADFWTLKDGSPEWMTVVCREAHSHAAMLPDDHRYEFIMDAIAALTDNEDIDDARDSLEPGVYTNVLTAWLASNINRVAYCDDMIDEYGPGALTRMDQILTAGMRAEMEEVFDQVLAALTERAELNELESDA